MKLDSFEDVLADVAEGRPIVMIDDDDRENEGDIVYAAERIDAQAVNFMIQQAKGLICLSLTDEHLRRLALPLQVANNTAAFGTNFTVSFDHVSVRSSGVSAASRAKTILEAVKDDARAEDFVRPGFVFPLRALPGGVLKRRGQTEGSADIARLAGLKSAGVICEIMDSAGAMLRGAALQEYCRQHKLKVTSVEEIVRYRLRHEVLLRKVAEAEISEIDPIFSEELGREMDISPLMVRVYIDDSDGLEHLVFIKGNPRNGCLVRLHSECLTGDVFSSARCDCGGQLHEALLAISAAGEGVVVYLQQEGRGIGLANKIKAYALQDQGLDTVDANLQLGFKADERDFRAGAQILNDLGLSQVRLMTNNPEKLAALESYGIKILDRVALIQAEGCAQQYLNTKRDRMGHFLP